MECPKCHQIMNGVNATITNNGKSGSEYKEYRRQIFHCEQDDIWISIESPISI